MKNRFLSVCLLLLISDVGLLTCDVAAQVPHLINYQGRLLNGTSLVSGTVGLSLRLYNVPSGGASLYEDSNNVTVVDGLYSTFLGDNTTSGSLVEALTNADVWLEVALDGAPLQPRERIASVAYALGAQTAAGVLPGGITAIMISNDSVSSNAINWADMPAGLEDGDNDTTYTAGEGLDLTGNQFSLTNEAVTAGKLADGAVTAAKLDASVEDRYVNVTGDTMESNLVVLGNVGIGTNEPLVALDVAGTVNISGEVNVGDATSLARVRVKTDSGTFGFSHSDGTVELATYVDSSGGWLGTYTPDALLFFVNNGGASLTIDAAGNVGVGTLNPGALLDVAGSFRVNGGTTYGRMQSGVITVGDSPTSAFKVVTNAFPVAFGTVPGLIVTPLNEESTDVDDTFAASVRRVSETEFVVNIQRVDAGSTNWEQNLRLSWHAWE